MKRECGHNNGDKGKVWFFITKDVQTPLALCYRLPYRAPIRLPGQSGDSGICNSSTGFMVTLSEPSGASRCCEKGKGDERQGTA
jgi:hypothetical protein